MSQAGNYTGGGTPLPDIETLTGDIGGPVGPDGALNINLFGTAGEILVTGNPGTNTLTFSLDGDITVEYPTDAGTAIPAAGILNVFGGTAGRDINTTGVGNTVRVELNNAIILGDLAALTTATPAITLESGSIEFTGTTGSDPQRIIWPDQWSRMDADGGATPLWWASGNTGNTLIGYGTAGDNSQSNNNTALGYEALRSLGVSDVRNTAVGSNAGELIHDIGGFGAATRNTMVGYNSLSSGTSANANTSIGNESLASLVTGDANIAIGNLSGSLYTADESSNIVIGNSGVAAENNTLRIGTQGAGVGQQNRSFMSGIYNVTPAVAAQEVVIIDSAGQLGSLDFTEEASVTPSLVFGGGSTGMVYGIRYGRWSRIGNIVSLNIRITLSNKGTSVGVARINLPGIPAPIQDAAMAVKASVITFTDQLQCALQTSTTVFIQELDGSTGTPADLTDANFANTSTMNITCSYLLN